METTENKQDILVLTEFETKYRVEESKLFEFKRIMEQRPAASFMYVEADDIYFVKGDPQEADEFLRLRFSKLKSGEAERRELTYKKKLNDKNNIQRKEINLRVDQTKDFEFTVSELCRALGYERNFSITKYCHIYFFEKACVVFQSVKYPDSDKVDHFIEIEVSEDTKFTEEEAWAIIREWEEALRPLGIGAKNRSRLSLFEMYRK